MLRLASVFWRFSLLIGFDFNAISESLEGMGIGEYRKRDDGGGKSQNEKRRPRLCDKKKCDNSESLDGWESARREEKRDVEL